MWLVWRTASNGWLLTRCRLCCHAFQSVFQSKQTKHAVLLQWLAVSMAALRPCARGDREELTQAVGVGA